LPNALRFLKVRFANGRADNGSEFTDRFSDSKKGKPEGNPSGTYVFDQLCSEKRILHRLTRAYRPQTNGMVERFNRRLGEALGSRPVLTFNSRRNRFHSIVERTQFIEDFIHHYNRTRLKCLAYTSPLESLRNHTK
jgi:transposase InsO family protein